MKDLSVYFPFLGIILTFVLLTVAEIFLLKFSKRVDSPKYIWYPILANTVGIIIVIVLTIIGGGLFVFGLVLAFGGGSAELEKYAFLMVIALVLIPILMIVVRAILFLILKLGKFHWALLYSFLVTAVNIIGLMIATTVFAYISTTIF